MKGSELAPGALPPTIDVMAYGPGECVERRIQNPRELKELKDRYPVLWVNVDGLGSGQVIFEIGRLFDLHPLALLFVLSGTLMISKTLRIPKL